MNAEIINVGNELLSGNTINGNAKSLSKSLLALGIKTMYHTIVGDYKSHIKTATDTALKRCDLVIYTGGLGPTDDDLTKEVVCEQIGRKLELDCNILSELKEFFKSRDIVMTENNIKQAYVPRGSVVLKNELGTADGFFINHDNKFIILLPGPPKEMNYMFENYAVPLLTKLTDDIIISKTINTIGIGESQLETDLKDIINTYENTDIATYASLGQVDIRVTVSSDCHMKAQELLEEICEKITDRIGIYIYSYEDEKIEENVFKLLKEHRLKVGFCESCTGGLVTSNLAKISGASEVLDRSIVTYSNKSKVEEVGVKESTLKSYGAVSREVAIEMAKGLLLKSDIDIAVSITGLAGPGGESVDKPIGLVYIALVTKNTEIVEKNIFVGSRVFIQERSSLCVFNLIRKHILTLL